MEDLSAIIKNEGGDKKVLEIDICGYCISL